MLKNIPDSVKELFLKDGIKKNLRVHFPNGEREDIINDNIIEESLSWTESLCSQSSFKFGLAESPQISFECFEIENIKGYQIECSIEIDISDLSEDEQDKYGQESDDIDYLFYRIPLGVFKVDSSKKTVEEISQRSIDGYTNPLDLTTFLTDDIMNNSIELIKKDLYEKQKNTYYYCIDMIKYVLANTITKYDKLPIKDNASSTTNDVTKNITPYGNNSSYTYFSQTFVSGDEPSIYVDLGYKYYQFKLNSNIFNALYSFDNVWGGDDYEETILNILEDIDPIIGSWYDSYWRNWLNIPIGSGNNPGIFTKQWVKNFVKQKILEACSGPIINAIENGSTNNGKRSNFLDSTDLKVTDGRTCICYPEYRILKSQEELTNITGLTSILLPYKIRISCKADPSDTTFINYKTYDLVPEEKASLYLLNTDDYISSHIRTSNIENILNDNEYLEASLELNGLFGRYNRQGKFEILSLSDEIALYPSEDLFPEDGDLIKWDNITNYDEPYYHFYPLKDQNFPYYNYISSAGPHSSSGTFKIILNEAQQYKIYYKTLYDETNTYHSEISFRIKTSDGITHNHIGYAKTEERLITIDLSEGENILEITFWHGREHDDDSPVTDRIDENQCLVRLDPITTNIDEDLEILYPQDPSGGVITSGTEYISIDYDEKPTKKYDRVSVSYEDSTGKTFSTHLQLIDSIDNKPENIDQNNITEYIEDYNPEDYQTYSLGWNKLIQESIFTSEEINKILLKVGEKLKNIQYTPCEIELIGRPWIQVGDILCIKTKSGYIRTIVLRRTMTGIDFLNDNFEAKGE